MKDLLHFLAPKVVGSRIDLSIHTKIFIYQDHKKILAWVLQFTNI